MRSHRTHAARLGAGIGALALLALLVPELELLAFTTTGARFQSPAATYYVNPNFPDASSGSAQDQVDALRRAADEWRTAGSSQFQFTYGGTTSLAQVSADGVNAVYYSPTDANGALAICYWWTQGNYTSNFDIVFYDRAANYDFVWAITPTNQQFDIQGVAVHEFGHALGLDHSTVSGSSMFATVAPGDIGPRSLHPDDIAGVQSIYGYAPPPVPQVTGVSPAYGWIDGGTVVQVTGSSFPSTGITVRFNGVAASGVTVGNATSLSAVTPPSAAGGPVDVEVVTTGGTALLTGGFEYQTLKLDGAAQRDLWTFFTCRTPTDAGRFYQAAVSLGQVGIPVSWWGSAIDPRIVPLTYDDILVLSVFRTHQFPIFYNMTGSLDPTGNGAFGVLVPRVPETAGVTLHFCFLAGDPAALSGVASISNAVAVTFPTW